MDFNQFQNLEDLCVNGLNFKCCLKIKDENQQHSIMRTIEKLFEKVLEKYQIDMEQIKLKLIELHDQNKTKSLN